MKLINLLWGMSLMAVLSACSDSDNLAFDIVDVPPLKTITLTPSEKEINNKLNETGLDIFGLMAENYDDVKTEDNKSGNLSFSPVSLSMALSMMANSVDGTDSRICGLFGVKNLEELNALNNRLMCYLSTERDGSVARLANSVWFSETQILAPTYTDLMKSIFYSEVTPIDFTADNAPDIINSWASAKTQGMIKEAVTDINPSILAMIINATYFDGKWYYCFKEEGTSPQVFHGISGDSSVDMMRGRHSIKHWGTEDYEIGVLPFKGSAEMVIVIPDEISVFEAAKRITPSDLVNNEMKPIECNLTIPKFDFLYRWDLSRIMSILDIPVSGTLSKMGINLFQELGVQQVTAMEVNEQGAKAAAVTVIGGITAVVLPTPDVFTVDRPFLFYIRDTVTGTVIMCGCINNI